MALSALERALKDLEEHEEWVEKCGGNLPGYIAKYGSCKDGPGNYSGDGGEAIYAADIAALEQARIKVRDLLAKQNQPRQKGKT